MASGIIKIKEAIILAIILIIGVTSFIIFMDGKGVIWLFLYFLLNLAYSFGLKKIPIIDISILSFGFILRLLYGAAISNIKISFWLCMTVMVASFYMGLGKRRNELLKSGEDAYKIRGVLQYYNKSFFEKNMYMYLGLAIAFYALWSGTDETIAKLGSDIQIWTVPFVIILAMRYSLDLEKGETGDPMEIILKDKFLIFMMLIYIILIFIIIYT